MYIILNCHRPLSNSQKRNGIGVNVFEQLEEKP